MCTAQDVELNTQAEVDAFFPGTTYNGTIKIGRTGSNPPSDITNLFNLSTLEYLNGSLLIYSNPILDNLDGLSNLLEIEVNLSIQNVHNLSHLNGLGNLQFVNNDIFIRSNNSLSDFSGLNNVISIGKSLNIRDSHGLINLDGFSNLESVSFISIQYNNSLMDISGFDKIERANVLSVSNNNALIGLRGFPKLTSIGTIIRIQENDKLVNLQGIQNVRSTNNLNITNNKALQHLDHFSNLLYVQSDINIENNENLTDCCGIQELLSDEYGVGGIVTIADNPSECSSQDEIINGYCGLKFNVFKNHPCLNEANGSIQVNVTNYDTIPFYYEWTRQEDVAVGSGISYDNYFNISMLEAGTYDLVVKTPRPDSATITDIVLIPIDGTFFEIISIESTNSSNELSNGAINIIVQGSEPPYEIIWNGPQNGSFPSYLSDTIVIPFLPHGEYQISIEDAIGNTQQVTLILLDETVPVFPCTEPLDIIILNDVSGSVDSIEYQESKDFFIDFLNATNIGFDDDDSRASIIEWSNEDQQAIKIPMTGDITELNAYKDSNRSFGEGTVLHEAMIFGEDYMESIARPDVERVLILATDGTPGQIPPSLVGLADQFKAKGYHILTIAFDEAYNNIITRKILFQMASIGALAPGAPAYSDLDENLAENIVNTYLCPIDPGSSSSVYFSRDGSININELIPIANCINPKFVDVVFTVEALRELSIPGGTYVSFYLNNPEQFGATKLLSWQIPCSIPADSSETYIVTLPMNGPSHIFAVLNDDGSTGSPIQFPITDIVEIAYSNNIDDEWICISDNPTLQAFKHTNTPTPSCESIIVYTINVCNISEVDASGVIITDQPPEDFVLVNTVLNLNECATENNGTFDISAGCCVSMSLTYDASLAALGYYGDQDVILSGPTDQDYFGYDGASSTAEDVILDGTIDCPSTIVEFFKEVNVTESCDDAFLTFTFTINNETNIPLHGLLFSDIVPTPANWVFEPYNITGLSIGTKSINQNIAEFVIDEVQAETVASFSVDLSLGFWDNDDILNNNATLANVPDLENGGIRTLTSNTTSTQIITRPSIIVPDTIHVNSYDDTIKLLALLNGSGTSTWTTDGDGIFTDDQALSTSYIIGPNDFLFKQVLLHIHVENECYSTDESLLIILEPCMLEIVDFEQSECDDNGTLNDTTDDFFTISFNLSASYPSLDSTFLVVINNDTIGSFSYNTDQIISIIADGELQLIEFIDSNIDDCFIVRAVEVENCSNQCELDLVQFTVTDCDDNDTPEDTSDDIYTINFNIEAIYSGMDSTYFVVIGNDTIKGFTYGVDQIITLFSSDNSGTIQFIDSQFESCFKTVNVGVENCIYPCELFMDQFTVSECDDNETSDDNTDDSFAVTFNLSSSYSGLDSTYFVIINMDTIGAFSYESEQTITLQSDGLDKILNFVDSYYSECLLSDTLNVQSCSNPCELILESFLVSDCDDNGTLNDELDDIFFITFNVSASYSGLDSTYLVIIENDTVGQFPYATEQIISLSADGIDHLVHLVDSQIESCSLFETVNVAGCSNPCELVLEQFLVSDCDDNGTPNDGLDDIFSITFNVSASYSGMDSTYLVLHGTDTIGIFPYGSEQTVSLSANGIEQIISFMDSQFANCSLSEIVNLDNCAEPCELYLDFLNILECDDNGTQDVISDDTYIINFSISASNHGLDSTYYIEVDFGLYGPFRYGAEQSFTFLADGTPDIINIMDSNFKNCLMVETTNLDHCSAPEIVLEDIIIPNIFSPNNDGINDDWTVEFYNGSKIISCKIYNRWGNLIYISEQGTTPIWDGTFNGKTLNSGVFVYKIIYQSANNEINMKLGDVTIFR